MNSEEKISSPNIIKDNKVLEANTSSIKNALIKQKNNKSIKMKLFRFLDKIEKKLKTSPPKNVVKHIIISVRKYNGDYGKGSIFENINDFKYYGKTAIISSILKFCSDENIRDKAKIEVSIPFLMNENDIVKLDEIVKEITSNNDYIYNESHYSKDRLDFNSFSYVDVIIDGSEFEVLSDDIILQELRNIIKTGLSDSIVSESYSKLIK